VDKIIETNGNVLENLFVFWSENTGFEVDQNFLYKILVYCKNLFFNWSANNGSYVDQHFLYKVLTHCKNIQRIGYPCKLDGVGGEEAAVVEQFLAAVDAKFDAKAAVSTDIGDMMMINICGGTNTNDHPSAVGGGGKLSLALGTHESVRNLCRRMEQQDEATAYKHQRNNRIQWMDKDFEILSRKLWLGMVNNAFIFSFLTPLNYDDVDSDSDDVDSDSDDVDSE